MPRSASHDRSARRKFLAQIASGAAVAGVGSLLAEPAGATEIAPQTGEDAWIKGIGATKHKAVYDAPELNDGFPYIFAYNYIDTMTKTYALKPGEVNAVVVLRHFGIAAGFTDAIWAKYKFGEMFKVTDPVTKKPSLRNIFVHSKAGDMLMPDASGDKLVARGVKICICNLALGLLSGKAAATMNMKPEDAAKEWVAGVIPGASVVPSGVLAVARAQEVGATYCFAS